jgi:hypothetical protein
MSYGIGPVRVPNLAVAIDRCASCQCLSDSPDIALFDGLKQALAAKWDRAFATCVTRVVQTGDSIHVNHGEMRHCAFI